MTSFFYIFFSFQGGGGNFPSIPPDYATANKPNVYRISLIESRLNWSIAKYQNTSFFAAGILFPVYKQEQITLRNKNIKRLNGDVET